MADEEDPLRQAARLAALARTELMDSPPEAAFDRFTRLAAGLIGAPFALVSFLDAERDYFKSLYGVPPPYDQQREVPVDSSLCTLVVRDGAPLIVDDFSCHPHLRDHPAVAHFGLAAFAGVPLALASGEVLGALCVSAREPRAWQDADTRLLVDLAAAVMTEVELRLAVRAREELMEAVSHDLKAPLTAIKLTVARTQRRAERPGTAAEGLARIDAAAERMQTLIHQVLDLGQEAATLADLSRAPHRLDDLVAAALAGARVLAEDRGGDLRAQVATPQVHLRCDAVRLGQALANLLHNAIEHTPRGTTVTLHAGADGGSVTLAVEDEGAGVAHAEQAHIFERRARGRDVRRRGHGLGLTIARSYVVAHGGTLTATNRATGGARFSVRLPRV